MRFCSRPGQSLVEVLIAIGILAMLATGILVPAGNQLLQTVASQGSSQAMSLAREGLAAARSIRNASWTSFATGTHGITSAGNTYGFSGTSDTASGFSRTVTVTDLSSSERRVDSAVTWTQPNRQPRTVTLSTVLTNYLNAVPPLLSGNWKNPQTLGTVDLGSGEQATGLVVRNKFVFMSSTASSAAKADFFIVDATTGTLPVIKSSLNTGPGLNDVAINGSFAYVANDDGTAQLQTINFSNTSTPALINSFRLGSNTQEALSVAVSGTLAFVGTEADSSAPEFYIVNVANPTSPTVMGSVEIGANLNNIFIKGNRAFLATSSSTKEFIVVNISNIASPTISASADLSGTAAANNVYVNSQDNHAFVVRDYSGSANTPELVVLNVTNPDAPTSLGSLEFWNSILSIFAADTLAFLGSAVSNEEFQIYDVSNLANMTYYSGLNFPQLAQDMTFESNIIYVAVRSNDALRIITSQ